MGVLDWWVWQMVHFITRFDEEDERDFLARAHINR
jgi:hypothetical protein